MHPQKKIIISVPHISCPPINRGHLCDVVASPAARELEIETKRLGLLTVLLEADIHRDPTQPAIDGKPGRDQNRTIGRGSEFREKIRSEIGRSTGTPYVIDMHSFTEPAFKNIDVGIMDPWPDGQAFWKDYVIDVTAFLAESTGLKIGTLVGNAANDIVITSRDLGAVAFLVEINESLSIGARRSVMEQLAKWLKKTGESPMDLFIW